MTLSGLDVVARGEDFESLAGGCELRAWQWEFLHDLDGEMQLRDAALKGGVDLDLALDFVAQCQTRGLVHVVEMTLDEFRRAHGYAPAQHDDASAPVEHESIGDYESAAPAWMMEPHDDAPAHEPMNEPVAEAWQPDAWQPETHVAHEPAAQEPVADAWQPDMHVANEPVAQEWQPDAWQPDTHVAHEPIAHEPVSEAWQPDAWQPEMHDAHEPVAQEWQPEARPVTLEFGAEPVAEAPASNGRYVDASASVADLMSLDAPHETPEARPAVAFSFGDDAQPSIGGGPADWQHFTQASDTPDRASDFAPEHAPEPVAPAPEEPAYAQYAYEPMSLVTTVDPTPIHPNEPHVDAAPPASAREQGSISFTFSPEMEAPSEPPQSDARAPEAMRAETAPPPARPASPPMQHVPSNAPPSPAPVKSDIVGNLIARALTFRIK